MVKTSNTYAFEQGVEPTDTRPFTESQSHDGVKVSRECAQVEGVWFVTLTKEYPDGYFGDRTLPQLGTDAVA